MYATVPSLLAQAGLHLAGVLAIANQAEEITPRQPASLPEPKAAPSSSENTKTTAPAPALTLSFGISYSSVEPSRSPVGASIHLSAAPFQAQSLPDYESLDLASLPAEHPTASITTPSQSPTCDLASALTNLTSQYASIFAPAVMIPSAGNGSLSISTDVSSLSLWAMSLANSASAAAALATDPAVQSPLLELASKAACAASAYHQPKSSSTADTTKAAPGTLETPKSGATRGGVGDVLLVAGSALTFAYSTI